MPFKTNGAGEGLISPATGALASQPQQPGNSASPAELPAFGLAVSIIAARYGLPLPWAEIVAAAAGLGGGGR